MFGNHGLSHGHRASVGLGVDDEIVKHELGFVDQRRCGPKDGVCSGRGQDRASDVYPGVCISQSLGIGRLFTEDLLTAADPIEHLVNRTPETSA